MTSVHRFQSQIAAPISTVELRDRLGDPDLSVVDVRPMAAYNGWRLRGEARGGHIPGAVAFPRPWLESVDEKEIQRLLKAKGITPDRAVASSGNGEGSCARLARRSA